MRHILPLLLAAPAFLSPCLAFAGVVSFANTTGIIASDGSTANPVGAEFETTGVTMSGTRQAGGYALTLDYATTFSGHVASGAVSTDAADIFLRAPAAGYTAQPFTFAIALGDESVNGGQPAGFYTPTQIITSAALWAGRTGYAYGVSYGATASSATYAAPVVMLSGQKIGGVGVASSTVDTGTTLHGLELYSFDVTITGLSTSLVNTLGQGFDAFWGTGDCANGAFLATYAGGTLFKQIPEPGTLPLALSALAAVAMLRRKHAFGR